MKWLKRLLKGIAYLLLLLLLAAIGFREWCVWRLPRMRQEVNDAWRDYAGIALDDVPKKFPPVETNEAALNLEKAAAKLGICLAPKKTDEKCPRNAPTDEAVKGFEALSVKDEHGEKKSLLVDYLNHEMEQPNPSIEPIPEALSNYLLTHQGDMKELRQLLLAGPPPRWAFTVEPVHFSNTINLMGHILLERLLALECVSQIRRGEEQGALNDLAAMEKFRETPLDSPLVVNVLIGIAEQRFIDSLLRKLPVHVAVERYEWHQHLKESLVVESWTVASEEAVIAVEKSEFSDDMKSSPAGRWHRFFYRLQRPWSQLSMLQMTLATVHDSRLMSAQAPCHADFDVFEQPGVVLMDPVWYKPMMIGSRHPSLSWWNPIGKVVYWIGAPNNSNWKRGFRLDLEQEMTGKVMVIRERRNNSAVSPKSIPGIESSACKNEKWNYAVNPDGSATLKFSNSPDWKIRPGAHIPLQWTEPAPGK